SVRPASGSRSPSSRPPTKRTPIRTRSRRAAKRTRKITGPTGGVSGTEGARPSAPSTNEATGIEHSAASRGGQHRPGGSAAPVERHVGHVARSHVLALRTDQPVVGLLLEDVRRPARDARDGEDRREQVGGDAE